jgi:hypothetical protein
MNFKKNDRLWVGLLALAVVLCIPAATVAVETTNTADSTQLESSSWDFPKEASQLIEEMKNHADMASRDAATLQAIARTSHIGWESHSWYLAQVRNRVNSMGKLHSRLQEIQHVSLPWQQRLTEHMTPALVTLANRTQTSLSLLEENRNRIHFTDYRKHVDEIYKNACKVSDSAEAFLEYAAAHENLQQRESDLEQYQTLAANNEG